MNDKELFLRTLDDLHASINSNESYEVLRASALIRQLFLDGGNSLVDRINRHYRLRLEFHVVEQTPPQIPGLTSAIWCAFDGIDPRIAPLNHPRVVKNRNGFFSMIVATIEDHEYSIHELVQFAAHVLGGVHSGEPKSEKEQKLAQLQNIKVFSHLSVALLFIRSIGRLILETLRPLAYQVRDLGRFENCPGLSIHMMLTLFPLLERENFLLDIGTEESRNRISVYLDSRSDLNLRLYDAQGKIHAVRAGLADCAYRYGVPTYINLQVASLEGEYYLAVEAGGWFYYQTTSGHPSSIGDDQLHYVLGSDLIGKAQTHMDVMAHCVYSRVLTSDEQSSLKTYSEGLIEQGFQARVHFEGNQFLHSQGHPNFMQTLGDK